MKIMTKRNAKEEFLQLVSRTSATVLWAKFTTETGGETVLFPSRAGSKEEWDLFLSVLNYDYDNGWGGEDTEGAVMFSDGSWAEREEYDGSSRWVLRVKPTF
jgi:hypothetical protein